ncbi:hypothetical protein AZE42_06570 [Rhizopogon vesiculosus]|uniref:DUF6534 domain-containing protein n=1 Tax=Rhizopogon vesiculosus TaxID=180088 RepID=A0A1J8R3W0_9AGAM|nr:hypothetical protein AZE42_06570 [Rhizopogon vesiculosus]
MTEVNIAQDYGPMLIGGLLAFGLSGCANMQFIVYWRQYSCEAWRAKSLVIATWLLDLCHSAFVAIALWDAIIVPFGDMSKLDNIPWSVGLAVQLTAMITFIVQSFFAYRIYRLQKKRIIVVIPIVALAFVRLVAASVSMGEMIRLQSYTAFVQHPYTNRIFTLGLVLSAVVDIMITILLCYFLRKNRTVIKTTTRIIDTLTLWTIRNGSITCAAAIATLICWSVMPQNRIFLGLHFVIAKLYAISLLATLNSRTRIRDGRQQSTATDGPLPIVFPEEWGNAPVISRTQRGYSMRLDPCQLRAGNLKQGQSIQVNVEQIVESKFDDDEPEPTVESRTEDSAA